MIHNDIFYSDSKFVNMSIVWTQVIIETSENDIVDVIAKTAHHLSPLLNFLHMEAFKRRTEFNMRKNV